MDVGADLGPLILGGLFAFGLSGCVNMQFVVYWQLYPGDRWTTKSLVMGMWFLDLCHSVFIAVAIWDSVILPYGGWAKIDAIPWSIGLTIELTAVLTFLEQSFFSYRIYRLQGRKPAVAGVVVTLAFIRLVTASVAVAGMMKSKMYTAFVDSSFPVFILATLGLSLSALVDILIAAFLCYFLRSNRTQIPRSSLNRTIDTLTLWTVHSGSITCLGAIASLVCLTAMPQNRIFIGLHFVVGKLYANSLLATLNARTKIRNPRKHDTTSQMVAISVIPGDAFRSRGEGDEPASPKIQRPYFKRPDVFASRPVNIQPVKSIKVNVEQTVEAKYDDVQVDVMSTITESARETETPSPSDF